MMAAPLTDTEESVVELQPLREAVAECIEKLNEQDRFIIDAINSEMISLQALGNGWVFLKFMYGGYVMRLMRGYHCCSVQIHTSVKG